MKKYTPLAPVKLRATLDPARIPYENSNLIPKNGTKHTLQPRAREALDLALHITVHGYNVYFAGDAHLGRSHMLLEYLTPPAKKIAPPPDMVYVHNFTNKDAPTLLHLPAGMGRKLKSSLAKLLPRIHKEIAQRMEKTTFTSRHNSLFDKYQNQREQLFRQMNKVADTEGFTLDMDETGSMTLYPLVDGKRLNEQEYENLKAEQRALLKQKGDSLLHPMTAFLRKLAKAEQTFLEEERSLEKEIVDDVLKVTLDPLVEKTVPLCTDPGMKKFFADLRADTLENLDALIPAESPGPLGGGLPHPSLSLDGQHPLDLNIHYDVNVFVDNSTASGAPVILEDHPTLANLMGCIEREAEMGALITDFTLIKAGAIHRANGGFLILHMDDLLPHSNAWEALLRALRSGFSRIEDASDEDSTKTKGLQPQPVPLDLKVILIGKEEFYEMLLENDDRFSKLFKIKAHLTEYMPRTNQSTKTYLHHLKRIIDTDGLLPFDREALAGIVDYGSLLIEDQQKLSLKFPRIREIMVEASAFASLRKKEMVTKEVLQVALDARNFRSNLVEEAFMEEYDRRIIKVATSGEAIGKVNGLAVSFYGDFEFGLPHQISCTVGAGNGGIIDLEHDAQLSGPIHTKAMMILKSYLVGTFAHNKPLVLTGSLGFEQNYAGIEGDSASGAELAALLSALSGAPIDLSLAFTGAVGQSGEIMAVGGVTRKIEGFFEVCKRHGLTGNQGVILPRDNITHLMLGKAVLTAIEEKRFHVYAVEHITEALEILTGVTAGKKRKDGSYTPGSIYDRVDRRLAELTEISTKTTSRRGRKPQ